MRWAIAILLVAPLGGCVDNSGLPCGTSATSTTVPGVTVGVSTPTCSFVAGTAATFDYTINIQSTMAFMTGPHAACMATTSNPTSFVTTEVTGSGGRYCPTCDLGICSEDPGEMITLDPGNYTGSLNFPGRMWDGPSDNNAPIGGPLPAGAYTAKVHFEIPAGVVEADLPITLL